MKINISIIVLNCIFGMFFLFFYEKPIKHINAFTKRERKGLPIITLITNCAISVMMLLVLMLIGKKDGAYDVSAKINLSLVCSGIFLEAVNQIILSVLGSRKHRKKIDYHISEIQKKRPGLLDAAEIRRICIITYDEIYQVDEIEKSLARQKPPNSLSVKKKSSH